MRLSRHRGQGQRRGVKRSSSAVPLNSSVEAPLYTLPHKEDGTSIGWNLLTDRPSEDMWSFRSVPSNGGTVHNVPGDKTFAQALTDAVRGDIIQVTGTVTGEFTLPSKSGSGWIIVRSVGHASLPAIGTRVAEADASNMATIRSTTTGGVPLTFAASASHWRFIGIIITNESGADNASALVDSTPGAGGWSTKAAAPNNLVFDRCWFKAQTSADQRRAWGIAGFNLAVVDSRTSGFNDDNSDSQAFAAWHWTQRLHIDNCYLDGDGENILFGGSDQAQLDGSYANTWPTDIIISRCEFDKPRATGLIKNMFEVKNGTYGLLWACVFHGYSDADDQHMVINFQTNNQGGTSALEDFTKCYHWTVRSCTFYSNESDLFRVAANNGPPVSETTHHIALEYCLAYDWGTVDTSTAIFQVASVDEIPEVTVKNCTFVGFPETGTKYVYYDADNVGTYTPFGHRVYNNAFAFVSEYHWFFADAPGSPNYLNAIFGTDNWRFDHNASIAGLGQTGGTPSNSGTNITPANVTAFKFTNTSTDDYSLQSDSPLKNAGSDGRDIGVNWTLLQANIAGVVTG